MISNLIFHFIIHSIKKQFINNLNNFVINHIAHVNYFPLNSNRKQNMAVLNENY